MKRYICSDERCSFELDAPLVGNSVTERVVHEELGGHKLLLRDLQDSTDSLGSQGHTDGTMDTRSVATWAILHDIAREARAINKEVMEV